MSFWETVPVVYHVFNNFGKEEQVHTFDSSKIESKVELWKDNINSICKIGNEKDFDVVILLQPIYFNFSTDF